MRPDPDRAPAMGRFPRRATDRVEDAVAWILTAIALLLIVVAGVTGLAVYGREAERVADESASKSQTHAVLLEDAHVALGDRGTRMPARVPARWTDRNGREHSGVVLLPLSEPAGTAIDVWIDEAGEITSRPVSHANAVLGGAIAALGVLCAGGTLLGAAWLVARRATGLVNARRWEHEWVAVEPQWRRTVL